MAFPKLHDESFRFTLRFICGFTLIWAVNATNMPIVWWVCLGLFTLTLFRLLFTIIFLWGRFILGFHGVELLHFSVKLDRLTTLGFVTGAGLFVIVWPLHGVLVEVILQCFTLFWGVSGAMQESCIFAGQLIAWMAYLFFLAFSRAALLGVGRRGGFYSIFLSFHDWHGRNLPVSWF